MLLSLGRSSPAQQFPLATAFAAVFPCYLEMKFRVKREIFFLIGVIVVLGKWFGISSFSTVYGNPAYMTYPNSVRF